MDIAEQLGLEMDLPIKPESTASQSMQALMFAIEHEPPGTFTYRWPVDMGDDTVKQTLRGEVASKLTVPDDDGLYYFAYVNPSGADPVPVLVKEGEAVDLVCTHHALMVAQSRGLLTYVRPVDTRDRPTAERVLRDAFGSGARIPDPGPHHYLVYVQGQSVLLPTHHVITFICDLWALAEVEKLGLMSFRNPADLSQERDTEAMFDELGEEAEIPLSGLHYYVVLRMANGKTRKAMIPLGHAPAWAVAYALASGHPRAEDLTYEKGLLPV